MRSRQCGSSWNFSVPPYTGRCPSCVAQERGREPALDLLRHLEQRHVVAGAGRALDLELVAVEAVQVQQRPDEQHVDGHPNRTAPVGVAAEHPGVRFGRKIG